MRRAISVCALFLAIVQATWLHAQTPSSSPAAAQQAKAWLQVFNSGDRDGFKAYLEKNRPADVPHLDGLMDFRQRTGGFELKKTEESTPTKYVALLKEKVSDQFARLTIEVEPEEPHRISKFELWAVPTPAEFAPPRETEGDAVASLRKYLEAETAAGHFSGAALVAKNGTIVFEQAYGMADREEKIANQANTKFRIGSMNKMITAVAIMQLVQAGKIQLSDTVGKYLPDYPNKDVASKVKIENLLTHTGGTGDIFGPEFEAHRLALRTLQDYVNLYGKRGLEFEPGSRWQYSNYGFILLGAIIENVAGQSYYDYVREHVYKLASMTSTDSLPETERVPDRSVGYMKRGPGPWQPNTDTLPWRGTSAGGGYSTVEDLYRFAIALEQHKLLDAEHVSTLMSGKVDTPNGGKYAYGFAEDNGGGLACVGHGGGAPGMNGELKICPTAGYIIVVLANMDPPTAQRVATFVAERLPLK